MTTTAAIAAVSPRAVEDVNAGNEAFGPIRASGEPPAPDECGNRAARPTDRIHSAEVEQGIASSRKPRSPKNQCVIFLS
ncbi:hypothetical protein KMZ93_24235 [Bradyrhizobium sediminis]|uniref:Uncharacterized protein n=1 Tax=Bradyrhizobium sediminis TaxID=2840469 RepID=A0A975NXX5_9BRAD|nr:hypothetical protein [Bradyrhizobium sediminis]QWG23020.1 hypothetical protein KMZ93_24235 [Bradyrhizobium sediminis]